MVITDISVLHMLLKCEPLLHVSIIYNPTIN